ncbi:MAG: TIGR01777 family oxidoreductase [Bryobacteraceae bacterium]
MSPQTGRRIVIPGGTGQVGTLLARHFYENGDDVTVITRHPIAAEWKTIAWTGLDLGPWTEAIDGCDVVINLAGRSVNCRYNAANQSEVKTSRTITTSLIGEAIAAASHPPPVWLNASTATIYRHSLNQPIDDLTGELGGSERDAPPKWRFSIDVATSWERAFFAADVRNTRRVAMRSAMTMSPDPGGVFDTLLWLVRWGLGGKAGSGKQYVSWIHDVDFIRAVEFLIEKDNLDGAVNLASPCPLPNREFMSCLRRAWCTSYIGIPAPKWMLEIGAVLLRTETELILKSRRVVPRRLPDAGFEFHFPNWRGACVDLVERWRQAHTVV